MAKTALAQVAASLSKYSTATGTTGNFALITSSIVTGEDGKDYTFTIVYSVDAAYSAYMAISEDGKTCKVSAPNTVTGGTDQKCKIHASAQYNSTEYGSQDFNILVKAVTKYALKDVYSLSSGSVSFNAIVTGFYGTNYQLMVGDGDYGMTLYQFTAYDGIAVGDYVNVSGTVSPYSGLIELKPATVTKIAAADAPELVTPTTLAITATSTPTIVTNMASRWTSIADGLVTSVAGSDGANLTIKVKVGTAVYTVFENATYCAAADYATFKQTRSGATAASLIAVNDVISVEGWSSFYTDPQLVGAKITKWTEGVAPSDTPITIANLANVGWKADTSYSLQGFVTGYYSGIGTPKNGMFISDDAYGLDVYGYTGDCSAFTVGTCVTVVGVPTIYNGLIEFTANKISVTATADITAKAAVTAELGGITGLSNSDVSRPVHVTGIVSKTGTENNKGTAPVAGTANMNVTLSIGAGESINAYLPKWFDATVYNSFAALADGDEVELTGWLANYKSKAATWDADLHSGVQVVSPTIVKTTAAASVAKITPTMSVASAAAAASGVAVDTIGFCTGSYAANIYQGIYIGDGEAAGLVYRASGIIGVAVGTPLHVVGSSSPYNALPEIDVSKGSVTALPKAVIADAVLAPAAALALSDTVVPATTNLNRAVTVTDAVVKTITTAVVAGKTNGTYVITVGTTDMTLYVNKASLDAAVYTTMGTVAVGGKISLKGFVGCYKTSMQIVNPSAIVFTPAA